MELDRYLFHEGTNNESYRFMGAHLRVEDKKRGVRFTTWAKNAEAVYVVGDFNGWEVNENYKLKRVTKEGIWTLFVKSAKKGEKYKFAIKSKEKKELILKSDPYARASELRPNTASKIVAASNYKWNDKLWLKKRKDFNLHNNPINIYEVHLGSWMRKENGEFLSYIEIKEKLVKYVKEMNYTHVEFMPLQEHPLDESWGYQGTGFYSPTSRFGDADQLRELIDEFHKNDIAVIMDFVPGHFCRDNHGLAYFDGRAAYEYENPIQAFNSSWGTNNFDLGKNEVRSFLISSAVYWIKEFHFDGIRVDAVSNMIYLNYGRESDQWIDGYDGSSINQYAVEFLQLLNKTLIDKFPGIMLAAEEATSYPKVSYPVEEGGLGFNLKWNMGWMNDTLKYIELEQNQRKNHHHKITFPIMYNYSENFILPLSHDEVVHGKKSILNKMSGDYWNKFAGLRNYLAYMMGHPGKKLLFMGAEIGQFIEWKDDDAIEFKLLGAYPIHEKTQLYFKELNKFYLENKALWELDNDINGFQWIDADNSEQSIYIFKRSGKKFKEDFLIFICNFTSSYYENYKIGVHYAGVYKEVFNSDDIRYGGSGKLINKEIKAEKELYHNQDYSINITVAPMATTVLKLC